MPRKTYAVTMAVTAKIVGTLDIDADASAATIQEACEELARWANEKIEQMSITAATSTRAYSVRGSDSYAQVALHAPRKKGTRG